MLQTVLFYKFITYFCDKIKGTEFNEVTNQIMIMFWWLKWNIFRNVLYQYALSIVLIRYMYLPSKRVFPLVSTKQNPPTYLRAKRAVPVRWRGPTEAALATPREVRQGSGGAAPGGVRGAEHPGKFWFFAGSRCNFCLRKFNKIVYNCTSLSPQGSNVSTLE